MRVLVERDELTAAHRALVELAGYEALAVAADRLETVIDQAEYMDNRTIYVVVKRLSFEFMAAFSTPERAQEFVRNYEGSHDTLLTLRYEMDKS